MPEYKVPGVLVEETSFRSKAIEGVDTSVAGFVGPARFGPVDRASPLITSYAEFERLYGDARRLEFADAGPSENHLAHAVRAFFVEGGRRLFVSRVFAPTDPSNPWNGHARGTVAATTGALTLRARFPGGGGNARVSFTLARGPSVLGGTASSPTVSGLIDRDVVWIGPRAAGARGKFYLARLDVARQTWSFVPNGGAAAQGTLILPGLSPDVHAVRVVSASVAVAPTDAALPPFARAGLALDPQRRRAGRDDNVFAAFAAAATDEAVRDVPLVIERITRSPVADGLHALALLLDASSTGGGPAARSRREALEDPGSGDVERTLTIELAGGHDGRRPLATDLAGRTDVATGRARGLAQFEGIEEIGIVAAPGASFVLASAPWQDAAEAVASELLRHCEKMRYRVAVLDCANGQSSSDVRVLRGKLDSKYGALYFPWVRVAGASGNELILPPSGFVAGLYARVDSERGVHKAPANEPLRSALGFESVVTKAQEETLNPEGINCLRSFGAHGHLVWGARTVSADPESQYINVRRYLCYLERSIEKGTQWAAFEPNLEALWSKVRATIHDFLLAEWQRGALLGSKPEEAFFVRCDRTTMTQNDLDNGRLVCRVGVAPLQPAEFLGFRVGQWTADRKA